MNGSHENLSRKNPRSALATWVAAVGLACLCAAAAGCATARTADTSAADDGAGGAARSKSPLTELTTEARRDSSIEISYLLGRSHRRIVARAKQENYSGQAYLDRQLLHEGSIDRAHYSEFFGKVEKFIAAPHRKPAEAAQLDDSCRTPFTVNLRVGKDTRTLQGCRGEDEGALSHLVREGEFLLYSKK
jgi:hypothetical protein